MSQQQSNSLPILIVAVAVAVALVAWPLVGGCQLRPPGGAEISSWWGKVKVKPLPPEPVLVAPSTRCLIFSATWCGPCRKLKVTVAGMARTGWRIGPLPTDDIEIIDVDGPDERLRKYKHSGVPTLVIVDQAGKELQRREGAQSADELGEWIRSTRAHRAAASGNEVPVKRTGAFELLE